MDIYSKWGFIENPFQPNPLVPSERGSRLFAGRADELETTKRRLYRQGKITCIEGSYGLGKTSLVNVAAYRAFREYLEKKSTQLLIPARETFQLDSTTTADSFAAKVYRCVAQTLLVRKDEVRDLGFEMPESAALDAWFNDPLLSRVEGGLSVAGWGIRIGKPPVANDGAGFDQDGLSNLVKSWLSKIFPDYGSGGVVCIIDNLEILESATAARRALEALRDTLFNQPGLRWVFCGASGILTGVAASARLNDYLLPMVEVKPLAGSALDTMLEARIREFVPSDREHYLPIGGDELKHLYWVVNNNLRGLLHSADSYCEWIGDLGDHRPMTDEKKSEAFDRWLVLHATRQYETARTKIAKEAWEILDVVLGAKLQGSFTAANFDFIKSNSFLTITHPTMAKHVGTLVEQGFISASFDDVSKTKREKTATRYDVLPKGSMAHYGRYLKKEHHALVPVIWGSGSRILRGNAD